MREREDDRDEVYRLRVGDYGVLYLIDDERQLVTVLDLPHR